MQSPVAMETEVLLMDTKSDYYKMPYSDLELDEVHGVDMTQATLSGMSKKKVNKPLMERRRRARINQSLTELKALVLDGMKKDPSRYSRLEKADILDMTVVHLKGLQKKALAASVRDEDSLVKYKAGFQHCADEIARYLGQTPGVDDTLKNKILDHVRSHIDTVTIDSLNKPPQAVTADGRPVASVSPMTSQSPNTSLEGSPRVVFGNVQLVLNGASNSQRLRMILPKQSPDATVSKRPMSPPSDEDLNVASSRDDVTNVLSPTHTDHTGSSLDGSLTESEDEPTQQSPLNLSVDNKRQVSAQLPLDTMWRPW